MNAATENTPGVWNSLRRILDTVLATAQNRMELVAVELQEEKSLLVEDLLLVIAIAGFSLMGLLMGTVTLMVLFWEHGLLAVVSALTACYFLAAGFGYWSLRRRLRGHVPLSASLGELQKDRECLRDDP